MKIDERYINDESIWKEMKRAIIIVKGDVQGVGYRGEVFKIARKLNITGFVENVKPYDVRIIAEGEKENIDKFIEEIKIEEDPILVEEVEVTFEEPTGGFEYFEIKRGDMTEELGERLDLARGEMKKLHQAQKETLGKEDQMLGKQDVMIDKQGQIISIIKNGNEMLATKQDQMLGKQDKMLGKQDQMIGKQDQMLEKQDETVSTLKEFRQDTMQRFDIIDAKYGKIAENMEKAIEAINRTCTNTERLLEKTERDRKDFRDSIEKLANAILGISKR
jgi:acylphosphatase